MKCTLEIVNENSGERQIAFARSKKNNNGTSTANFDLLALHQKGIIKLRAGAKYRMVAYVYGENSIEGGKESNAVTVSVQ